jgi:hypothetical protein
VTPPVDVILNFLGYGFPPLSELGPYAEWPALMPGNTTIEIRLISLAVDLFGTVNVSEQPLKTSSKSCLWCFPEKPILERNG